MEIDAPPRELGLPLTQEAHQSLSEIDTRIAGSDQILDAAAIVSARVQSECHPFPNISLLIVDLETLETLSKMVSQVNNHLRMFLFGFDTALVKRCYC